MREIKFRAWDTKEKKIWENVSFAYDCNTKYWGIVLDWDMSAIGGFYADIELMQYTGLKDKNGKEIYEGDIIHYKHETGFETWDEMNEEVKFENGMFSCAVYSNFEECDGEVIGNIYENPELLKTHE